MKGGYQTPESQRKESRAKLAAGRDEFEEVIDDIIREQDYISSSFGDIISSQIHHDSDSDEPTPISSEDSEPEQPVNSGSSRLNYAAKGSTGHSPMIKIPEIINTNSSSQGFAHKNSAKQQKIISVIKNTLAGHSAEARSTAGRREGTWVQCSAVACKKWRHLEHIDDPCELKDNWICSMNPDPRYNCCSMPQQTMEEEGQYVYCNYVEGSVVWAKMGLYPWWPAMVMCDPDWGTFFDCQDKCGTMSDFHVVFLDNKPTRSWLPSSKILPFRNRDESKEINKSGKHYSSALNRAIANAERAVVMSIKERLETFSFLKRYKGSPTSHHAKREAKHKHRGVENGKSTKPQKTPQAVRVQETSVEAPRRELDSTSSPSVGRMLIQANENFQRSVPATIDIAQGARPRERTPGEKKIVLAPTSRFEEPPAKSQHRQVDSSGIKININKKNKHSEVSHDTWVVQSNEFAKDKVHKVKSEPGVVARGDKPLHGVKTLNFKKPSSIRMPGEIDTSSRPKSKKRKVDRDVSLARPCEDDEHDVEIVPNGHEEWDEAKNREKPKKKSAKKQVKAVTIEDLDEQQRLFDEIVKDVLALESVIEEHQDHPGTSKTKKRHGEGSTKSHKSGNSIEKVLAGRAKTLDVRDEDSEERAKRVTWTKDLGRMVENETTSKKPKESNSPRWHTVTALGDVGQSSWSTMDQESPSSIQEQCVANRPKPSSFPQHREFLSSSQNSSSSKSPKGITADQTGSGEPSLKLIQQRKISSHGEFSTRLPEKKQPIFNKSASHHPQQLARGDQTRAFLDRDVGQSTVAYAAHRNVEDFPQESRKQMMMSDQTVQKRKPVFQPINKKRFE